ncbi:hypothetical protein CerSpe_273650 [Prunus speciosa]
MKFGQRLGTILCKKNPIQFWSGAFETQSQNSQSILKFETKPIKFLSFNQRRWCWRNALLQSDAQFKLVRDMQTNIKKFFNLDDLAAGHTTGARLFSNYMFSYTLKLFFFFMS